MLDPDRRVGRHLHDAIGVDVDAGHPRGRNVAGALAEEAEVVLGPVIGAGIERAEDPVTKRQCHSVGSIVLARALQVGDASGLSVSSSSRNTIQVVAAPARATCLLHRRATSTSSPGRRSACGSAASRRWISLSMTISSSTKRRAQAGSSGAGPVVGDHEAADGVSASARAGGGDHEDPNDAEQEGRLALASKYVVGEDFDLPALRARHSALPAELRLQNRNRATRRHGPTRQPRAPFPNPERASSPAERTAHLEQMMGVPGWPCRLYPVIVVVCSRTFGCRCGRRELSPASPRLPRRAGLQLAHATPKLRNIGHQAMKLRRRRQTSLPQPHMNEDQQYDSVLRVESMTSLHQTKTRKP